MDRSQRRSVVEERRLALVRDADAGDVVRGGVRDLQRSAQAASVASQISSASCSTQPG
jgi:hypothetical protein